MWNLAKGPLCLSFVLTYLDCQKKKKMLAASKYGSEGEPGWPQPSGNDCWGA